MKPMDVLRPSVQRAVEQGTMPLVVLHSLYAARAADLGIDSRRVQIADGRRELYRHNNNLDDEHLRALVFFHTGTVEGPTQTCADAQLTKNDNK